MLCKFTFSLLLKCSQRQCTLPSPTWTKSSLYRSNFSICTAEASTRQYCHVSIAWIPGHAGVHGNEVADYLAKSGSKSKIYGPEPFITVPYASCVSTVKDWSTDRWKSMWNKRKDCLRMKESVGWTSSRLTMRLLHLKRPQLNRVVQVLTGHCNLQRHKKTTGRAESSLCPKCSLEDETPNHHVGNCKLYQDIRVKYFGITKTTVHNVVTKCNINKLATYLKEAGRLSEFDQ